MANLQIIKDIATLKKIPLKEVAQDLGMSAQALSKLMRENSTKIETLEQIALKLKVPVRVFFEEDKESIKIALAQEGSTANTGDFSKIEAENSRLIAVLEKHTELLSQSATQLATKDKQIDRLLTMLENHKNE